jgi:hypothetical protein
MENNSGGDMARRRPSRVATLLLTLALATCNYVSHAQHGHLNAGAVGQNPGDQLVWANGAAFVQGSGYVQNMTMATSGTYSNYYNSGPTMTALPATVVNGGPAAFAPAIGSFINVQISLVSAPVGGVFSFWESGSLTPTFNLSIGGTTATPDIPLSAPGAGTSGADPYGHIHGRRFTATVLGDYILGFQLFDTTDLGAGGNPIHTPSEILYIQYSAVAVPEPTTAATLGLYILGFVVRHRFNSRSPRISL